MLNALKSFLDGRSPALVIALGLALVALIGTMDQLTGSEVSLKVFYLLPIVFVTWYARQWAGYFFCVLCAMVSVLIDYAGHSYNSALIPVLNLAGRLGFYLLSSYVLGRLKTSLNNEKALARTDGLTGLLNARAFTDLSRHLIELAARYNHPAVLAYIDIDDFKAVNDTLGHSEGDRVLETVANTLTRCVRATDVVGRLGGDEFAVFLPETDYAGAQQLFGKIREELPRDSAGGGRQVGFSIGVAVFSRVPSTIDEALKIADQLMYRVKKAGKNNMTYEEQAGDGKDAEQRLAADARKAARR